MKHLKTAALVITAGILLASCADAPDSKISEPPHDAKETDMDQQIIYDGSLTLTLPESPAVTYHEKAQRYLSKENAKVHYYADTTIKNPGIDTVIEWEYSGGEALFTVEYGLNEDLSDALTVKVTEGNSCALNNLYKGSRYYVRVTANDGGSLYGAQGSFETTDVGPRVMTVDGIYNVRDIGGYKTADGKTTLQGMIYRGGQMDGTYVDKEISITEEGIDTMLNVMGVRYDMDLRGKTEQGLEEVSPLPGVAIKRYSFAGYNTNIDTEAGRENLRAVFSDLADPDIYPVYIHCQGGADRTGVLCFMINALVGVDIPDLVRDYEFTTFSLYGARSTTSGGYLPYQDKIRRIVNRFEGDTVKERVERILLYAGVTPEEIASIRSIMLGEEVAIGITEVMEPIPAAE